MFNPEILLFPMIKALHPNEKLDKGSIDMKVKDNLTTKSSYN